MRGQDLNLRPSGYEPDELPSCSTPRLNEHIIGGSLNRVKNFSKNFKIGIKFDGPKPKSCKLGLTITTYRRSF